MHLLSNKKSVFKQHPYKTWLLIKYCHIQDALEWQFPITIIYVHFHALWIYCSVKTYFSKKLHILWYISAYKTLQDWTNQLLLWVLTNNVMCRTWKLDHTLLSTFYHLTDGTPKKNHPVCDKICHIHDAIYAEVLVQSKKYLANIKRILK